MSVPPGDTARSGRCSSGVCALCPRAVGQGATLDGTPGRPRTCKPFRVRDLESRAFPYFRHRSRQPVPPRERHGLCR